MKIKKAFTLIELLIVLTIIAIVTAITVPSLSAYQKVRQNKNCSAEMDMLVEEVESTLSSQRFGNKSEVDEEILRTILNHVQGTKFSADGQDVYSDTMPSDLTSYRDGSGNMKIDVQGICTNNGTYTIAWTVSSIDNGKYQVRGNLGDDKFVECNVDNTTASLNYTTGNFSDTMNIDRFEDLAENYACEIYDHIQTYLEKTYSGDILQFMKDTPGCLGSEEISIPETFTNSKATNKGKSELFNADCGTNKISRDLLNGDEKTAIVALTVNPDKKILEYLVVEMHYTEKDAVNEDTYYISMFNDSGEIAYFNGDIGKYYPAVNSNQNVYSNSSVSVMGTRGSYTANINWSASTVWKDIIGERESTESTTAAAASGTDSVSDFKMTGAITRIGNYIESNSFAWDYYQKNWYYQHQNWTTWTGVDYPRRSDVTLKSNTSYDGLKFVNGISESDYRYLKNLEVEANYNLVEGVADNYSDSPVTITTKETMVHNSSEEFKNSSNSSGNLNGYIYLKEPKTSYNPLIQSLQDGSKTEDEIEDEYISAFNSADILTIYLTYNEKNQTDQIKLTRSKSYKKYDLEIYYDADKTKKVSYLNDSNPVTYSRDKIAVIAYYIANYGGSDIYLKGDLDYSSLVDKLVIIDEKGNRYTGETAETKLYAGGKFNVYIALDGVTIPSSYDSSKYYCFKPYDVPDIYYTVGKDSEGNNIATVVSAKQYDPNNTQNELTGKDGEYVFYGSTNKINIPSNFLGSWEKIDKSVWSGASSEERQYIKCFKVGKSINYYRYKHTDDTSYKVTKIGGIEDTKESLSPSFSNNQLDLSGNIVYLPTNTNLWSISIPSTVTHISQGAFAQYDYSRNLSKNSVVTVTNIMSSGDRYIKSISIANGSSLEYIGAYAFFGNTNLQTISIPTSVKDIGDYAFGYCYNMSSISLNSNITTIREGTFLCCASMNRESYWSSFLPKGVTSIGAYAFKDCWSMIGTLDLSKLTGIKTVGSYAFYNCHNISSISLPESIGYPSKNDTTSIGTLAFGYITTSDNNFDVFSKTLEDMHLSGAIQTTDDNSSYSSYRGNYTQRKNNEVELSYLSYDAYTKYNDNMFTCTNYYTVMLPSGDNPNKGNFANISDTTIIIRNYYENIGISGDFNDNALVIEQIGSGITDLRWGTSAFNKDGLFKNGARIGGDLFIQNVKTRLYDAVFQPGNDTNNSNIITGYTTGYDYSGGVRSDNRGNTSGYDFSSLSHNNRNIAIQFAEGNLILKDVNSTITWSQTGQGNGANGNPTSAFCMEYFDTSYMRTYGFKSIWLDNVGYIDNYSFDGCLFADYAIITDFDEESDVKVDYVENRWADKTIKFLTRDSSGKITSVNGIEESAFAAMPLKLSQCVSGVDSSGNKLNKYYDYQMSNGTKIDITTNINGLIRGSLAGYFDNEDASKENVSFDISKIDAQKSSEFELYLPEELYIYSKIHSKTYGADSIHPINTITDITKSAYYELYKTEIDNCLAANGSSFFGDTSFEHDHETEYKKSVINKNTDGTDKSYTISPFEIKGYDYELTLKDKPNTK